MRVGPGPVGGPAGVAQERAAPGAVVERLERDVARGAGAGPAGARAAGDAPAEADERSRDEVQVIRDVLRVPVFEHEQRARRERRPARR